MTAVDSVSSVAIIGAGAVGASWTAYFLSRGKRVAVYDPEPERALHVKGYIKECWPALAALTTVENAGPENWTFHTELREAVSGAQYIQESAPDDFATKRKLFEELDRVTRPTTIIGSSTSSLVMSDLQGGLATGSRFLVAHPFHPPHIIPVVEIVGGQETSSKTLDWCRSFFERNGKVVLRLKREVVGHLINRLQAALLQEAICLVRDGVADVGDIDRGVALGPAVRWALMGPLMTLHLAAREGGIRSYLQNLGPALQRIWKDLGSVDSVGADLVEQLGTGLEEDTAGVPLSELIAKRDASVTELVVHLDGRKRRLLR